MEKGFLYAYIFCLNFDIVACMNGSDIRTAFLSFFEERGHAAVPSSSLIPDDPSVLLTTAGMQQFKPYYTGALDPLTTIHPSLGKPLGVKSTASVQKSFRTSDIEEVGDHSHLTFFEMLGNFSFGGYFKEEAIAYAFDFISKTMNLEISYVTIFEGSHGVPRDEDSKAIWNRLGITDVREDTIENVFWGPTGSDGPCGPTTEIYCKNADGKDIEVWNIVFNEYFYPGSREELLSGSPDKKLEKLEVAGVDTGMGLERLCMISQKTKTIFDTDLFAPYIQLLPGELDDKKKRVMTDHMRGSIFLLADGVRPSNKERGYILRRLLRRTFVYEYQASLPPHILQSLMHDIIHGYGAFYPELMKESESIREGIAQEREKFLKTLTRGLKEIEKIDNMTGLTAFDLYQSYGLPGEVTLELKPFDWSEFEEARRIHSVKSSEGAEKKFGGHGLILDTGELKAKDEQELKIVTRLHTATHLLQAALRKVLGESVHQMGSDITGERTRFDFAFERKLTPEEIKEVEDLVNHAIASAYDVVMKKMPYEDACKLGALHFFKEKYPEEVNVYSVGRFGNGSEELFSREFCGGPHVPNTSEIGSFKITKEEAVASGVRRIRATI